jgi:hypothetical protein
MKYSILALAPAVLLIAAAGAEARKNPGNPLPAPNLVSAEILAAGDGECDGDELTTEDVCVELTFVKVCEADKYSVEVAKGFDTTDDGNGCTDTTVSETTTVVAEACTGDLNCLGDTAECQTAQVPLGTTTICLEGDDPADGIDCVNDPDDIEVESDAASVKLKGLNPPKKGGKSVSQSTPFSNTVVVDSDEDCI